jgi:hypothetical protein
MVTHENVSLIPWCATPAGMQALATGKNPQRWLWADHNISVGHYRKRGDDLFLIVTVGHAPPVKW